MASRSGSRRNRSTSPAPAVLARRARAHVSPLSLTTPTKKTDRTISRTRGGAVRRPLTPRRTGPADVGRLLSRAHRKLLHGNSAYGDGRQSIPATADSKGPPPAVRHGAASSLTCCGRVRPPPAVAPPAGFSTRRIPVDQSLRSLGGQGSNLQQPAPKAGVLPVELPPTVTTTVSAPAGPPARRPGWRVPGDATRVAGLMGSLIKKRRKRMRKKKHRKMLKRTRVQRRRLGK